MRWIAGFIVLGFGVQAPCPAAEPPPNEMCPVMQEEKADPAITVSYKGRTIAFCCDKCVRKFNADPEKYVARLPAVKSYGVEPIPPKETPTESKLGEQISPRPPLLARYHPVFVHFPLAGFPLALVGFLLFRLTGKQMFAAADVVPLLAAVSAAALAVASGNVAGGSMRFSASVRGLIERHQFAGITLLVVGIIVSTLRLWRWNRLSGCWLWIYGGGLLLACSIGVLTGYLGGSIVFGADHLSL